MFPAHLRGGVRLLFSDKEILEIEFLNDKTIWVTFTLKKENPKSDLRSQIISFFRTTFRMDPSEREKELELFNIEQLDDLKEMMRRGIVQSLPHVCHGGELGKLVSCCVKKDKLDQVVQLVSDLHFKRINLLKFVKQMRNFLD